MNESEIKKITNKPAAEVTDEEARFAAGLAVAKHGVVSAEFSGRDNEGRALIAIKFAAEESHLDGNYSAGRVLGISIRPKPARIVLTAKEIRAQKSAKKAADKAARIENRMYVDARKKPMIGSIVEFGGRKVRIESFGREWLCDNELDDMISELTGLDGAPICYAYFTPIAA